MKDFIKECIGLVGVKYYAERKYIEAELNFYQFLFIDKTERFRYLEVFFNSSDIFCLYNNYQEQHLLESSSFPLPNRSISSELISRIRVGDSFEDCRKYMISNVTESKINLVTKKLKINIMKKIFEIYVPKVQIINVEINLKPVAVCIVTVVENDVFIPPIRFFIGEKCEYPSFPSENVKSLIDEINGVLNNNISLCRIQ